MARTQPFAETRVLLASRAQEILSHFQGVADFCPPVSPRGGIAGQGDGYPRSSQTQLGRINPSFEDGRPLPQQALDGFRLRGVHALDRG